MVKTNVAKCSTNGVTNVEKCKLHFHWLSMFGWHGLAWQSKECYTDCAVRNVHIFIYRQIYSVHASRSPWSVCLFIWTPSHKRHRSPDPIRFTQKWHSVCLASKSMKSDKMKIIMWILQWWLLYRKLFTRVVLCMCGPKRSGLTVQCCSGRMHISLPTNSNVINFATISSSRSQPNAHEQHKRGWKKRRFR